MGTTQVWSLPVVLALLVVFAACRPTLPHDERGEFLLRHLFFASGKLTYGPGGCTTRRTFPAAISLDTDDLDAAGDGFVISGDTAGDYLGYSVSSGGDFNGDGIDDLLIGAKGYNSGSSVGAAYVIYGSTSPRDLDLASLTGAEGFRLRGTTNYHTGQSVAGPRDLNGDNIGDAVIGSVGFGTGRAHVVYGRPGTSQSEITLASLASSDGYRFLGITNDNVGHMVSLAGDLNGDGLGDIIISDYQGDPGGNNGAGYAHILFGQNGNATSIDLNSDNLDGLGRGFNVYGGTAADNVGFGVIGGHDMNGDGVSDFFVGSYQRDLGHVIYGGTQTNDALVTTTTGFRIDMTASYRIRSTALAEDFNGDGLADLLLGSRAADPYGRGNAGQGYIVFGQTGQSSPLDLGTFDLAANGAGFNLFGPSALDQLGRWSGVVDYNADGLTDVAFGAVGADSTTSGLTTGVVYVVPGKRTGIADIDAARFTASDGLVINGEAASDYLGSAISAGDLNGDACEDLIVGAFRADPYGRAEAGRVYVIFGGIE